MCESDLRVCESDLRVCESESDPRESDAGISPDTSEPSSCAASIQTEKQNTQALR